MFSRAATEAAATAAFPPMLRDDHQCGTTGRICEPGTTCQGNECKVPIGDRCTPGATPTCGVYPQRDPDTSAITNVSLACKTCTGTACGGSANTCQVANTTLGSPCINFIAPCASPGYTCAGSSAGVPGACKASQTGVACSSDADCFNDPATLEKSKPMLRCDMGSKKCANTGGQLRSTCFRDIDCANTTSGKLICSVPDDSPPNTPGLCKMGLGVECATGDDCFQCKFKTTGGESQSNCCAAVEGVDHKVCIAHVGGSHVNEPCTTTAMCQGTAPLGPHGEDVALTCNKERVCAAVTADSDTGSGGGCGWKWSNVATLLIIVVVVLAIACAVLVVLLQARRRARSSTSTA